MSELVDPSAIECIILDVDGVLTDGKLYVHDDGSGARQFHVHDGFAIRWFLKLGGQVAICTGKTSRAVAARAAELKIEHVIQGSHDKLGDVSNLLDRLGLGLSQAAMLGDDLPDLPVLNNCGYPIAVANAASEVRASARYVTPRPGGAGAVRDALEHLMRYNGMWQRVQEHYGATGISGEV